MIFRVQGLNKSDKALIYILENRKKTKILSKDEIKSKVFYDVLFGGMI